MRKTLGWIWHMVGRQGPLFQFLVVAVLLLAFGLIADEVMEGSSTAFDAWIVHAFRNVDDLSSPVGPTWLQSMARDITALGSVVHVEKSL